MFDLSDAENTRTVKIAPAPKSRADEPHKPIDFLSTQKLDFSSTQKLDIGSLAK
jgi:hypothetical protein